MARVFGLWLVNICDKKHTQIITVLSNRIVVFSTGKKKWCADNAKANRFYLLSQNYIFRVCCMSVIETKLEERDMRCRETTAAKLNNKTRLRKKRKETPNSQSFQHIVDKCFDCISHKWQRDLLSESHFLGAATPYYFVSFFAEMTNRSISA